MRNVHAINFSWLIRLRWGAIVGQVVVILIIDRFVLIPLPLVPLLVVVAVEVATNAACMLWLRREVDIEERAIGVLMALDVLLLTTLLYLSGGPSNPFSFLYLVHMALGAMVLRPRWTWALLALSFACFGALFLDHVGLDVHHSPLGRRLGGMTMHLAGMWVAFGLGAAVTVYSIHRVRRALADREAELATAREATARSEVLASLATLAAGAAHELSTPLATIAVIAKELERRLEGAAVGQTMDDARLIRRQVDRCRNILDQLAADAGESAGEAIVEVAVQDVIERALDGLPDRGPVRVTLSDAARAGSIYGPPRALAQALRAVLRNALEASPTDVAVELGVSIDGNAWQLEVKDRGAGMAPEVAARAGQPFFTTKEPGRGMGLGLFLTRTILERLGGHLELRSAPAEGTTAVLSLPAEDAATIHRLAGDAVPGTP